MARPMARRAEPARPPGSPRAAGAASDPAGRAPDPDVSDYPLERWSRDVARAWSGELALTDFAARGAVEGVLAALDAGDVRVAEKVSGEWVTHGWIQQAITLYFRLRTSQTLEAGALEFFDKIPTKRGLERAGVRVVPPGVARYGCFLERGVILMPG